MKWFLFILYLYLFDNNTVISLSDINYAAPHTDFCQISKEITVTEDNVDKFEECTIFKGIIKISNYTFVNMNPDRLNPLNSIKEIHGTLDISGFHQLFTDLSFLKNLEIIDSFNLSDINVCISIKDTSLISITLPKLRQIGCSIHIQRNKELCYSDQWKRLSIPNDEFSSVIKNNKLLPCPCSEQCIDNECWGPESDQCFSCKGEKINTGDSNFTCITNCTLDFEKCEKLCSTCDGPCSTYCVIVGNKPCSSPKNDIIAHDNIEHYRECEEIKGNVIITTESFKDMQPNQLEVFSKVKHITGYLYINAFHVDFKNLSYFGNLEFIHGDTSDGIFYSLIIDSTSLESLELKSLKKINHFGITITDNKHLCYAHTINWITGVHVQGNVVLIENRDAKECENDKCDCDSQCSENGCWGSGPEQCISCLNFQQSNKCVEECDTSTELYDECHKGCPSTMFDMNGECKPCHDQCVGCNGSSANECIYCKHFKDEKSCVQLCPESKYALNGECLSCPTECHFGCSRINSVPSCNTCYAAHNRLFCMVNCPIGYFQSGSNNNRNISCSLCDTECAECYGPGPDKCNSCKSKKVFISGNYSSFICTSKIDQYYCEQEYGEESVYYCLENYASHETWLLTILIIAILFFVIILFAKRYAPRIILKKGKSYRIGSTKHFRNDEEMALINERKMFQNIILGTHYKKGAFGNLYLGYMMGVEKSLLVIKILNKKQFKYHSGLEDRKQSIMHLEHDNLLKVKIIPDLLSIMLVTELIPLGNVLTYILNNPNTIKPQKLLLWCKQIADGMHYLEHKKIVHGNLHAANVMVHVDNMGQYNAKIKDFAQLHLLQEDYRKTSVFDCCKKMKNQQCLHEHNFTHKSDVWAFGLTMQQLLTFGEDPWEYISLNTTNEVRRNLKWAISVPCPIMCKDKMFQIMRSCWYRESAARPNFQYLSNELEKITHNPLEYINLSTKPTLKCISDINATMISI